MVSQRLPGDKSTWLSHVNEWAPRGVPAKDSAPPMTDTPGAYARSLPWVLRREDRASFAKDRRRTALNLIPSEDLRPRDGGR
jgi:hypothetical protein